MSSSYVFIHSNQIEKQNDQFYVRKAHRKLSIKLRVKRFLLTSILSILCVPTAQAGNTTADFLEWERKSQETYLSISIGMATTIASQVHPEMASCLNDWYYKRAGAKEKHNEGILKVMQDYKDYHPSAVVMAYLENVCGDFKDGLIDQQE